MGWGWQAGLYFLENLTIHVGFHGEHEHEWDRAALKGKGEVRW